MGSPMLALPAGATEGTPQDVEQHKAGLPLTVLVAGAGVFMFFGGLVAAYLALKASTTTWPPQGVKFDNYTATTLAITAFLGAATIEWAAYGIRKGFRGQAIFGYGVTFVMGLAFLNALYYLIGRVGFGAGSSPYGTVVHAMLALALLVWLAVVFAVAFTALRTMGHQLTTRNQELARATAFAWHIGLVAWLVVYYTVYIAK